MSGRETGLEWPRAGTPGPSSAHQEIMNSKFGSPKALSQQLSKRLLAYATVASASAAAFASQAHAEVVYTPTHKYIDQDYCVDLNHDGINDFHIHSYYLSGYAFLQVLPLIPINKIAAVHKGCLSGYGAAPLPKGDLIGPGMTFAANATCMAEKALSSQSIGPWLGAQERYLGFEFFIDGQKHYGWARMSVDFPFAFDTTGRILGYAYETIPGKPIIAGDEGNSASVTKNSGTLGSLALGSAKF
jgi:hypothetical protein